MKNIFSNEVKEGLLTIVAGVIILATLWALVWIGYFFS